VWRGENASAPVQKLSGGAGKELPLEIRTRITMY